MRSLGIVASAHHDAGGGAPWAPSDLATLSSWYDPSDAANRTVVSFLFTELVNKEGTTSRNLVQATAGNCPALNGTINGLDALDFDGSNDWMGHSAPNLFAAGACTVAAVFRAAPQSDKHTIGESTANSIFIYSLLRTQNPNSNGAPDSYGQVSGGGGVFYGGFSDGTVAFLEATLDNHVWVGTDSGSAIIHYVDGNQSSNHAYTRQSTTPNAFTVGCLRFNNGTFTFFDGLVGEIVCCTSVLGTSDRQKLEGYLCHKWGAADELDAGHPYKSAAP